MLAARIWEPLAYLEAFFTTRVRVKFVGGTYKAAARGRGLIQLLGIFLGIEHNSNCVIGQKNFHHEAGEYMPGPLRRFLLHVAQTCNIRDLAILSEGEDASVEHQRLRSTYLAAVDQLCKSRSIHIQRMTRHILLPSKKAVEQPL